MTLKTIFFHKTVMFCDEVGDLVCQRCWIFFHALEFSVTLCRPEYVNCIIMHVSVSDSIISLDN